MYVYIMFLIFLLKSTERLSSCSVIAPFRTWYYLYVFLLKRDSEGMVSLYSEKMVHLPMMYRFCLNHEWRERRANKQQKVAAILTPFPPSSTETFIFSTKHLQY